MEVSSILKKLKEDKPGRLFKSREGFFKQHKKIVVSVLGAVLIFILVFLGWQYFLKKPPVVAKFELSASITDSAGIDPKTPFILKSSEDLSANLIKKILVFEPEIDFEVKKIDSKLSGIKIFKKVFAQEETTTASPSSFEIQPKEALNIDTIYRVSISDEEVTDREYSWAYQVKAPFQIISTHPRDEGTSVPVNSGIEITFNRENFINPEKYFLIEPAVKGTFEISGNTLIFLPEELDSATVYTVTIKKGLVVQGSDEVLSEDYVFRFETGLKAYEGRGPYFDFQNDFIEFIPGYQPTFKVFSDNIDVSQLEFNLYKFSNVDEFLSSYQKSRQWFLGWAYYYRRQASSLYQPESETKIISFKPEVIKVGYEEFIEIPQVLEQGYYLIDAKIGEKHRQAWLQITSLSHYFSITNNQSLLWIYDFQKKSPVKDIQVAYIEGTNKINSGQTNEEGLIQFSTPENLRDRDQKEIIEPQFFRIDHQQYPATIIKIADNWGYRREVSQGDLYWDHFSTDRYTYQMNDTLKYWGVIKGRSQNIRQKKVTVGIYEGWWGWQESWGGGLSLGGNEPLVMQEAVISSFDTIQGQLQFKGLTPGFYNLAVILDGEVVSQTSIQVLTYTKPAYQITVTPSSQAIFAGQPIDFKIRATFFDGTPVSKLHLKYNTYWKQSIEGELVLDESGQGSFSYTPYYYEEQYNYWPKSFSLNFSPKMSEEGEMYGSGRVLVFGPNIYCQSFQKKESENTYKFTAKLNQIVLDNIQDSSDVSREEYIGQSVKGHPISANIVKITYRKIETGQYYDYINKVVRKKYSYQKEEQAIEQLSGTTDNNGEWSFSRNLPKEASSLYRVEFSTQDFQGRKAESSTYIWYASYKSWKDFQTFLNINGSSYEEEFSIGEKINLELQITEGEKPSNAKVLFYRYQNNIDKVNIISSLTYEEVFNESFIPSVQYLAVILGPYGFEESNSVTASFQEKDNSLAINIEQDKEAYRPGEQINLKLQIKDQEEKGVASEINVAVVDEALFHILPYEYYSEDILTGLYRNIWLSPLTHASQYAFLEAAGAEKGCFAKGTTILMADGSFKNIEDIRAGDQILTWTDNQARKPALAIVQGISQHWVDKYLIINHSFKVTPEHRLYINGQWIYASNIKEGDELINQDGASIKVNSIIKKQDLIPVYNIIVSKYHTYFADGFYVHNEEKGGEARANFVDVAFYDTVRTDSGGKASISFISPDNITAWRVTARAFAPDSLKAGQSIKLIKTSLPFFIEATLNNVYLVGDKPIMRVRVFGTDFEQGKNTEFEVESESLGIQEQKTSQGETTYIPLGSLSEGEHEIIISAKQGEYEDAIVRKISVVKSYFKKGESSFYKLSSGLADIEGNKNGFTKLKFMDLSKGRLYCALWWNRYSFGIRVDQVVPQYLANKFLAQYFDEPWQEEPLDLSSYHLENGGLGLFPYSDDDLALSAKLADLVPEFVFQEELKKYLYSSLTDKKADIRRISQALYGLASLSEPVLVKINLVRENPELNLEDRIYLALALAKLGDKESARTIYFQEIRGKLRFQGQEAWLYQESDITKRVKLTGLIAVLASYLGLEDIRVLGEYILTHNPEKDLDKLEESLYMKSELNRLKESKAKFQYKTNMRSDSVILEKGKIYELTLPYDELQSLRFSNIEGDIALVSFYERAKDPQELTKNPELSLNRIYLVDGRTTNSFSEGDVVLIRLDPKIAQSAIDGQYQIIDYLPSGLKPITQIYQQGLSSGTECHPVWYPSIIENNIIYFNIWKGFNKTDHCSNRTLNYYARVISKGSYTGNPAIIQSLKDLESLNLSSKSQVEIK